MSLLGDFSWYFEDTYLGLKEEDGTVTAIYINGVNYHGDEEDIEDNYCDSLKDDIHFTYHCLGNGHHDEICINDPRIVYELPELGFVKIGSEIKYLTYRAVRSVKKGFTRQRIDNNTHINDSVIESIFKNGYGEKLPFRIDNDSTLIYKYNLRVGKVKDDGTVELIPSAEYLRVKIEGILNDTNSATNLRI